MSMYDYGTEAAAMNDSDPATDAEARDDAEIRAARRHLRVAESIMAVAAHQAGPEAEAEHYRDPVAESGEWAVKAAYVKALEAEAARVKKELKDAPMPAEAADAYLPDGSVIGSAKPKKGFTKRVVKDAAALLDYVSEHFPDKVVFAVDPEFVPHLLKLAAQADIPGVGETVVKPTFEAKVEKNAYGIFFEHLSENPDLRAMIGL